MIASMTAFARCVVATDTGSYTWEIRSVNHRYAEVFLRMPEEFRSLESPLRSTLLERVKRGKIDCNLRVESTAEIGELTINDALARSLSDALSAVNAITGKQTEVNPMDILKWPGVIESHQLDNEQSAADVHNAFEQAVAQLIDSRRREGTKLGDMVAERCDGIAVQIAELRRRVPEIIESIHARHTQRLSDYAQDLDKARIEQECALLMQKLDIAEELDRLEAHLDEVRRVLKKGSPAGRRLDFLMQELNREANTIGSKSAHIDSSTASIELKVLIEQMREQIQNIE